MRTRAWIVVLALLLAAAPLLANTQIPQGGTTVTWNANCNQSKSFSNGTGRPICDFRFEVQGGGTVHPRDILVENGIGNWTVDDNEDGDTADPNENDDEDSSPSSPSRVERDPGGGGQPAGRCIKDGGSFGISLCGDDTTTANDDNTDMTGKMIKIIPTAESGKDIVAMANIDGVQVVTLVNETAKFNPFLCYSTRVLNTSEGCVDSISVTALDEGVPLADLATDWPGQALDDGRIVFDRPLPPGESLTIDITLDALSKGETTSFQVDPPISAAGSDVPPVTFTTPVDIHVDSLVFQGQVLQVGASPGVWSGGYQGSQWVRYKVLSGQGVGTGSTITVHHTLLVDSADMDPSGAAQLDPVVFTPGNVVWIEADLVPFPYNPLVGLNVWDGARVRPDDGAACLQGLHNQITGFCLAHDDALSLRAAVGVASDHLARKDRAGANASLDAFEAELQRLIEDGTVQDRDRARRFLRGIDRCRGVLVSDRD